MPDSQQLQAKIRLVVLGGFLGSGKTTALLRLGGGYAESGRRVGIITNDQADGLVDTEIFRARGFVTEEIPKGCFCCKFDELVAAAGRLADGHRPDVLLAEPVGSCTDIVATVINPLKRLYADRFRVAPYITLLDPDRAFQALSGVGPSGFSAKVTYIYKMQQNEADVVAINKIDTLTPERLKEVTMLVERNFPKAEVIAVSARTGEGFERLVEVLDEDEPSGRNAVDVDYNTYADGEAQLGWLNATLTLTSADGFDANSFLLDLAEAIRTGLRQVEAEPAHVKMILRCGNDAAIANLVASDRNPELSRRCDTPMTDAKLIVNARVETDSRALRGQVETAVERVAADLQIEARFLSMEDLAPGRPHPTHRFVEEDRRTACRAEEI